jgi:prophage antirepressor-like protein
MSNLSVFAGEYNGNAIRTTNDGRFSVYDVLTAFGVCSQRDCSQVFKRIADKHSEVLVFCQNIKFPGRGQKETPVATEDGIYQILMLCPGRRGAEFRSWASQVIKERREEESNPELAYTRGRQRAINTWKKQGKSDREIAHQIKSIESRCYFTETLKDHGVTQGSHFGMITNEFYLTLFGAKASELKEQRNIPKSGRLKDSFSMTEQAANMLAEALATEKIKDDNLQGPWDCRDAAKQAADRVKRVFE